MQSWSGDHSSCRLQHIVKAVGRGMHAMTNTCLGTLVQSGEDAPRCHAPRVVHAHRIEQCIVKSNETHDALGSITGYNASRHGMSTS